MTEGKKIQFPVITTKAWWVLRKKFKQSIPGVVTDQYIATILNMKPKSARSNILPALKETKLIDQDEKPTELAKKWRDDKEYASVCEEIKKNIYPSGLLDAVPDPISDSDAGKRWFGQETGAGENAVKKMLSFYKILCEADASKSEEIKTGPKRAKTKTAAPKPIKPRSSKDDTPKDDTKDKRVLETPDININLQIHISADSSPEQIDQIFSSMSKHIYKK